ncbi:MAG: amino acid-binding protein [Congregibacter sp.]|nr:amino acid-binding protein [Congregibacter sp.]
MTTRVLISFFCDDRPGVIEQLSALISDHEGNWLDSQLSRLGGRFAGVLQAQIPQAQYDPLSDALKQLQSVGITSSLTDAGSAVDVAPASQRLTLLGPDRPGIVRELTRALRSAGFNIRSLKTAVETAPMSGEPLFRAEACIELNQDSRLDELEWQLDAMAEAMTLEIDVIAD